MKNDYIDIRSNGTRPEPEPECKPECRGFNVKIELNATDILKIIALIGGIIITCFLIIFAYLAGLIFGVLLIVGMIAFIVLILKGTGDL